MPDNCGEPGAVTVERIACRYGNTEVLSRLDLDVRRGEVLALLGPSGCGKTTLLRLIAGLVQPSAGRISIAGEVVADAAARRFVPPERRLLGMVFQDYALWPHLTVLENVLFPLEMRRVAKDERRRRAEAALARVGLAGFAGRRPGALSGGQQQRVSIARALVAEPRVVLFDEPLSNLDRELRDELAGEIAALVRGLGLTAVYVTHDQSEAFALADRVAVMRTGRIVQLSAPEELVESPAHPEVADFLQLGTLAEALRDGSHIRMIHADQPRLKLDGAGRDGERGRLLIPRRALALVAPDAAPLKGRITGTVFRGDHHVVSVCLGTGPAAPVVQVAAPHRAEVGALTGVALDAARLRFFPSNIPSNANEPTEH